MSKKNLKYIIGGGILVVVIVAVVLLLTMCGKDEDKPGKEQNGVEGGLQVEETGDGDEIDFEDFISDEEGSNTDTDNDGVANLEDDDDDGDGIIDKDDDDNDNDGIVDKEDDDDDGDGVVDKKDPEHPSYEGPTEEDKEEDKEDDKEDEEQQWSEFF